MTNADPAQLARKVHDTAAELARCLATDVRVDPVQVFVPLLSTTLRLREIADELSRAARPVDDPAALAAQRAGELFAAAGHQLTVAIAGLRS